MLHRPAICGSYAMAVCYYVPALKVVFSANRPTHAPPDRLFAPGACPAPRHLAGQKCAYRHYLPTPTPITIRARMMNVTTVNPRHSFSLIKLVVLPAGGWLFAAWVLLGLLLAACDAASTEVRASFAPEDVVYDQPLHGSYGTGSSDVSSVSAPPNGAQPRIEAVEDFIDFGRVLPGEQVEHTFIIRNSGDSTLKISRLYTTCSYMFADLSGSVIPPGRVALLVVTMNLAYHSDADQGLLRRGAILESNDPQQPETTVWVQLRIER